MTSPAIIDRSCLVEEETIPGYVAERYYPAALGQTFGDRYKTIGELGYGSASTVWLCRDLHKEKGYVALKVYVNSLKTHRELPIYRHINALKSKHGGRFHIRRLLDSFNIAGPDGDHICLVHEPLGISLGELKSRTLVGPFEPNLIRQTLRSILTGLQFLHNEAHVIHTDLQANNMLLGIHDNSIFTGFEQFEAEHPLPHKRLSTRTIYLSRQMPLTKGEPVLSDLSEARWGNEQHPDVIMPDVYRAPEVILGIPWSYPVDIWAFGMVLWELFEPRRLFRGRSQNGTYSEACHLAEMVAIMGPPPLDLLQRSKKSNEFWDAEGNWKANVPIPDASLEMAEKRLEGDEKDLFLTFMRKMLQWKPEDRGTCHDVFFDEWLLADLIVSGQIVRDTE